jgi:hypothetical protein
MSSLGLGFEEPACAPGRAPWLPRLRISLTSREAPDYFLSKDSGLEAMPDAIQAANLLPINFHVSQGINAAGLHNDKLFRLNYTE